MKAWKYKNPMNDSEKGLRMEILEDNGDRVLVVALIDMPMPPTWVERKSELEETIA